MNPKNLLLAAGLLTVMAYFGCTKSTNPVPPGKDTVTLVKTDTLLVPKIVDTPNLTNGLVLYLTFNGSWADSSGGGNTVTPVGGATLGYDMHGYPQSAFSSSGNGARLIVSNNGAYKVDTAFSVSFDFMIRADAYYSGGYDFSGLMSFLSIVDTLNGNGPTFNVGLTVPGSPQNFTFGVNSSASSCSASGNGTPLNLSDMTGFIPQVGSWYNAICIFANGSDSIYINGKLVSTKSGYTPSALFCANSNFVIGGWWNASTAVENINGSLDEVRFYNRTLTAAQIAWLSRNFQPSSTKMAPVLKSGSASSIGAF